MPDTDRPPAGSNRGNLTALLAILALAGALFFVFDAIQKHNALQNCLDSGRRDCIPIAAPANP